MSETKTDAQPAPIPAPVAPESPKVVEKAKSTVAQPKKQPKPASAPKPTPAQSQPEPKKEAVKENPETSDKGGETALSIFWPGL